MPADERARLFIAKLQRPKGTRPRTAKTLASAVAAFFQKQITDAEVAGVVAEVEKAGFITVTDGRVSYLPVGQPAPGTA
jgi:hypothetical protein